MFSFWCEQKTTKSIFLFFKNPVHYCDRQLFNNLSIYFARSSKNDFCFYKNTDTSFMQVTWFVTGATMITYSELHDDIYKQIYPMI